MSWLSYTLLAAGLATVWRNRSLSMVTMIAALATASWAAVHAVAPLISDLPLYLDKFVELVRYAAWIFLLLAIYSSRVEEADHPLTSLRWIPWYVIGVLFVVVVLVALPSLHLVFTFSEAVNQYATRMIWLVLSLLGLVLVEQIYRNSSETELPSIKYTCLGLGFLFAYDFFMYAEAVAVQQVDEVLWQARGAAIAFTALLLAVATWRKSKLSADRHLSRHVVFHTFVLLAGGMYLLLMALVGFFVQYIGGTWGDVYQVVFLSVTGLGLLVLLLSRQVRARARVWVSKNFLSYKYDYRREWIGFTQTLAEGSEDTPQSIAHAMSSLAGSPGCLLWMKSDRNTYDLVERWQMDEPVSEGDLSALSDWLEKEEWIIDLYEWRTQPGLYAGLEIPDFLIEIPRAWLVVPLFFRNRMEGFLLLLRPDVQPNINWEDRDLLKVAGYEAASHLAQYRVHKALVELRQFEAYNRLSAYVIHDLKNILAQQSLILSNATRHRHNPEFIDDVIDTIGNSVSRMNRLMAQMRSGIRGSSEDTVGIGSLLAEVITGRMRTLPQPRFENRDGEHWVVADREQLRTVFSNLVQNAQEATAKSGTVRVSTWGSDGNVMVEVEDDGLGMDEAFIRDRLFKPFESTKGLTGMGIGAYESREFVRSIGGDIKVSSTPGAGSRFLVVLPCARDVDFVLTGLEGQNSVG